MTIFGNLQTAHPPEAFIPHIKYHNDQAENKLNLVLGGYRTEDGLPWVFPVVKEIEKELVEDDTLLKEYFTGQEEDIDAEFIRFLLGKDSIAIKEKRVVGFRCTGAAGSMRIGAEFLTKILGKTVFYYSNLTWGSHKVIFLNAGFETSKEYTYWSKSALDIDFECMLKDLENAEEGNVVILQTCSHNPTGRDLNEIQWRKLATLMKEKKLIPFFDNCFQGIATGDYNRDASAVRLFVEMGLELFCVQSFSKSFGLYGERVGQLTVVINDSTYIPNVKSQTELLMRSISLVPPMFGARIVYYILKQPEIFKKWQQNVQTIIDRIKSLRKQLKNALERGEDCGKWEHITQGIGMTCLTGLNERQVNYLAEKYHIYIGKSGAFNITCLNVNNMEFVVNAIKSVIHMDLNTQ